MIVIGIDPGKAGGIAMIYPQGAIVVKRREEFDPRDLGLHFVRPSTDCIAYIERAMVMPKQGSVSGFTFGTEYGKWLGALEALGIPHQIVTAKAWQAVMLAGYGKMLRTDRKRASIEVAQRLYPDVQLVPDGCRKAHDGMAEALLIAAYGQRIGGGTDAGSRTKAG